MYPIFYPSPHIHIPIYLVVMSLAFTISIIYAYKRSIQLNLPPKISTEISIAVMIGAFFGARFFHIIFEYPQYYLENPMEIFKFYKGGFVFYGGLFGGLLFSYLYVKKIKQNFLNWLDCFALVLPVGYMIGRVGCIFAGCCYGKECSLPWAIRFPVGVEAPPHVPLHPTQIYSILIEFIIWMILVFIEKKKDPKLKSGQLFFIWLLAHGIGRLIVEQFRGDFRGEPILGLSISSLLSIALVFISSYFLVKQNRGHL
jgi:phosphatidylglycerol:prolipoprotein diacylglycerol transferase